MAIGRYGRKINSLLGPLVLATDLLLLLGSEIVLDVESLSNLLGALSLDHVGNGLASNIKKRLDIQVVGSLSTICVRFILRAGGASFGTYQDDLEEHLLVDLHELLIPLLDIGRPLARVRLVVVGSRRVALVVLAPLDDLLQNGFVDLDDGVSEMRCR